MRTALAATAITALALFTAAPTALATSETGDSSSAGHHTKQAERLMRTADRFDRKAGAMRTRAGRLRSTALKLRQEAEELAGTTATDPSGAAPVDDTAAFESTGREGGETTAPETDASEDSSQGDCLWGGDDDLGFSREFAQDPAMEGETAGNGDQVCRMLRTADRLEHRAGALDTAAARMQKHACKLREKAAKLLGASGEGSAERLLTKAAKLRDGASRLRAYADTLRETAFDGADVDDDVVDKIRALELKAAAKDRRADRLEARAAAMVN